MTQKTKFTRRRFFRLGLYALAPYGLAFSDGFFIERKWIHLNHIVLSKKPTCRIAHFTDVHHKGDMAYFKKVIAKINSLQPDFVCFTGDLIEEASYLEEAISCLQEIQYPLFGIPGMERHIIHCPSNMLRGNRGVGYWFRKYYRLTGK